MCVNGEALISVGSAYGGPREKRAHSEFLLGRQRPYVTHGSWRHKYPYGHERSYQHATLCRYRSGRPTNQFVKYAAWTCEPARLWTILVSA